LGHGLALSLAISHPVYFRQRTLGGAFRLYNGQVMTDWRLLARARGLDLPEEQLAAIERVLEGLEGDLRPLTARLGPQDDPAIAFQWTPDDF